MKKIFISFAILAGVTLSGCNDSFLDKLPVTDPTEETVLSHTIIFCIYVALL